MDPRAYQSDAAGTPPDAPTPFTVGYPQPAVGAIPATEAGPWWFYMVGEELRNVIIGAGLAPDPYSTVQVLQAILKLKGKKLAVAMFGSGFATASGVGSLTAGVSALLAGSGSASGFGAAALKVFAGLAGAGSAAGIGSASLTLNYALGGHGTAPAAGSASLFVPGAVLAGAGLASASGSASPFVVFVLSGAGTASAFGTGALVP